MCILIILICELLILPMHASATEEEAIFIYREGGLRDPFVPLVTKDGKIKTGYSGVESMADIVLEGIMYDPAGDSVAVINDTMLRVNEKMGKVKIKRIEPRSVVLEFNGKEHIIKPKE